MPVFLPTLGTDRFRLMMGDAAPPPETPLILVGRDGRCRVVTATAAAALEPMPGRPWAHSRNRLRRFTQASSPAASTALMASWTVERAQWAASAIRS